jgi:flagellar hook-length control protein FliK
MLGQLTAATPQQAGEVTAPRSASTNETDDAVTDAPQGVDVAALFPLSLPLMPPEARPIAPTAASGSSGIEATTSSASSATVAVEARVVSQLIGTDDGDDKKAPSFDVPPLPPQSQETHAARATATPEAALARPVHQPVGSRAWADEIGSRVMLMTEHGKQTASLRLSPEHLGPLEIQVAIHDDQASVWFGAAHADTRAAIENALPRLRALFASQGLSLADAGVFREPPRQQTAPAGDTSRSSDTAASPETVTSVVQRQVRLGLIDAYA